MSVPRNLFAHTAPQGSFPEYISVNADTRSDVDIRIDVRSPMPPNGNGENAFIYLTPKLARELGLALIQATN